MRNNKFASLRETVTVAESIDVFVQLCMAASTHTHTHTLGQTHRGDDVSGLQIKEIHCIFPFLQRPPPARRNHNDNRKKKQFSEELKENRPTTVREANEMGLIAVLKRQQNCFLEAEVSFHVILSSVTCAVHFS